MAQAFLERGHRITFLANADSPFKMPFDKYGFETIEIRDTSRTEEQQEGTPKDPMKEMIETLLKSKIFGPGSSKEKMEFFRKMEFLDKTVKTLLAFNPQMKDALASTKFDLIIIDQFVVPPALMETDVPFFYIYSGNPLPLYDKEELPPPFSGYSINSDQTTWPEFRALHDEIFVRQMSDAQKKVNAAIGFTPSEEHAKALYRMKSPYLNCYGYPAEVSDGNFRQLLTRLLD